MKKLYTIILSLLISQLVLANKDVNLSNSTTQDSVNHYISLAIKHERQNPLVAEKYIGDAIKFAHVENIDSIIARVQLEQAAIFKLRGRFVEAIEIINSVITIFERYNNRSQLTKAHLIKGGLMINSGTASDAAKDLLYVVNNDFSKDSLLSAEAYVALGMLHYYQILEGKPEKTSQYFQKGIRLLNKSNTLKSKLIALNSTAVWQSIFGTSKDAFTIIEETIELSKTLNDNVALVSGYHNLASFYLESQSYAKANEYFNMSIKLCDEYGLTLHKAKSIQGLSRVLIAMQQYDGAIELLDRLKVICEENRYRSIGAYVLGTLSKLYYDKQDYKKSADYSQLYNIERDSIGNNLNATEQRIEFEKVSQLQQNKIESTISRSRTQATILVSIILLLGIILTLLFVNLRNKKKWLKRIEEKNSVIMQQALEMKKMLDSLDIANQSKEKMLSVIAHDLINPFNSIIGLTDLAKMGHADTEKQEMYILRINEAAKEAFHLLEQLLLWSRLQSDKIQVSKGQVFISQIVRQNYQLYQSTAETKKIHLVEILEDNLIIDSDENFISTIIRNLLSNAIKFTHEGGTITIKAENDPDAVRISIQDTGVGMSLEMLEKLVNENELISKKGTNKESGTGLGLSICYEFAQKIGAEIKVESEINHGTCFTLILPKEVK